VTTTTTLPGVTTTTLPGATTTLPAVTTTTTVPTLPTTSTTLPAETTTTTTVAATTTTTTTLAPVSSVDPKVIVVVVPPTVVTATQNPATTTTTTTTTTTLAPTTVAPTIATPVVPPTPSVKPGTCGVGDLVWNDKNGNGKVDDGELGIAGVTVTLTRPDGSTVQTTTNATGVYRFDALPCGNYRVTVTPPTGATNTFDLDGNKDSTVTVLLQNGSKDDVDFGYKLVEVAPATVNRPATPATPPLSFTGSNSTRLALWALAILLTGWGLLTLGRDRKKGCYF
jgi:serine-aspartate repeat-containing protein C/D/E